MATRGTLTVNRSETDGKDYKEETVCIMHSASLWKTCRNTYDAAFKLKTIDLSAPHLGITESRNIFEDWVVKCIYVQDAFSLKL